MSRKSIKPTQKPKSTRAIKKVESPPISMTPLTSLNISRNTIEFQPRKKSELERLLDEDDERERMNPTNPEDFAFTPRIARPIPSLLDIADGKIFKTIKAFPNNKDAKKFLKEQRIQYKYYRPQASNTELLEAVKMFVTPINNRNRDELPFSVQYYKVDLRDFTLGQRSMKEAVEEKRRELEKRKNFKN